MLTNHKAKGTGYSEFLLDSGLVTSGCLKSVLSGKAYAKALFFLNVAVEALDRLLIEVFCEEHPHHQIAPEALFEIINNCNRENLNKVIADESTMNMIHAYQE